MLEAVLLAAPQPVSRAISSPMLKKIDKYFFMEVSSFFVVHSYSR